MALTASGPNVRFAPANLADSIQARVRRLYPGARYLKQNETLVVPVTTAARQNGPSRDAALITWVATLLSVIFVSDSDATEN